MTTPMTEYRRHSHGHALEYNNLSGPNAVIGYEKEWQQMTDPRIITTVPSTVKYFINRVVGSLGILTDPEKLRRLNYAQVYLEPALGGEERISLPFQIAELAVRWNEALAGKLAQIKLLQINPKPGYGELFARLGMQPVIDEIAHLRKLVPNNQPTNGESLSSNEQLRAYSRRFHPHLFRQLADYAGTITQEVSLPPTNGFVVTDSVYTST